MHYDLNGLIANADDGDVVTAERSGDGRCGTVRFGRADHLARDRIDGYVCAIGNASDAQSAIVALNQYGVCSHLRDTVLNALDFRVCVNPTKRGRDYVAILVARRCSIDIDSIGHC